MLRLRVCAGLHDRREAPCLARAEVPDGDYLLRDEAGLLYPAQAEGGCLAFVIPFMRAGEERVLELVEEEPGASMRLEDTGREVRVLRGELHVASYRYAGVRIPYIYPVNAALGLSVTELSPRDHPHHFSMWTAHGDVSGEDFWAGDGVIRHLRFRRLASGPAYAEVVAENSWEAGGRRLLLEVRRLRFWNVPSGEWLIDYEVELRPVGEVVLGDTKEAGVLAVRVAPSITVRRGGRLTNSWGGVNEGEVWGRRACWCDYSGPLGGSVYGIAVFDHPGNPRHPTYWHARDYGLMAANPFGLSHFTGGRGDMRLAAFTAFKYRIYVHRGWTREARVADKYVDYVNPPRAEPV